MPKRSQEIDTAIDRILEQTFSRPKSLKPPKKMPRKPIKLSLREWAGSQVAAYRIGLLLGYLAMIYFGTSAFLADMPTFRITAPEGWTPVWATVVVFGGLIAAIGSIKAGAEPITKEVRRFNRIELTGAVMLFLTLGTYATLLLILGYGYGDAGRASIGAGFVALGVHPTIRMFWLIFRPRFIQRDHHRQEQSLIQVGSMLTVPTGYAIVKLDESGNIIPETRAQFAARLTVSGEASAIPVAPPSRVGIQKEPRPRA